MHHKRVGQEKNKLLGDIQKVQEEILTLQPQLDDWKDRYETLRKERMMVQLEKERLEKQVRSVLTHTNPPELTILHS